MALDFPTSPSYGDTYGQYVYDGAWQLDRPSSDKTPTIAVVSGASVTPSYDGTAAVYSFTSSGNIIIESAGYADVLLVGGGGGGGLGYGAGGGAGGVLYIENAYLPAGSLDVTIGVGGLGRSQQGNTGMPGGNGGASSLHDYFVPGGGGGSGWSSVYGISQAQSTPGQNGASGGGASGWNSGVATDGGLGILTLGNDGGQGNGTAGGGGGGAGAAGATAPSGTTGGDGGNGVANSITGSAVTYGGGGGGCGSSTGGSGGSGGGAAGSVSTTPSPATANTGGGGGGAFNSATPSAGSGGSGIVIVRINS